MTPSMKSETPTPRTDAHEKREFMAQDHLWSDFARQLECELSDALFILGQIINDLPSKRDWLNPDTEKAARELLRRGV